MAQQGATDSSKAPGSAAVRIASVYWMLTGSAFSPTTDRTLATHVWEDDGAGAYTMTAIGSSASPARMRERASNYVTYDAP